MGKWPSNSEVVRRTAAWDGTLDWGNALVLAKVTHRRTQGMDLDG